MKSKSTITKKVESKDPEIRRFQRNLNTFRKLAGWTAEELGKKVGLTKQSIHNLETNSVRLSPGYYVSLRTAFEDEADKRNDNGDVVLRQALDILLNQEETEEYIDTEEESRAYLQTISDAQKRGMDKKLVWSMLKKLFPIIGSAAIAIGAAWLHAYQSKDKDF
ncbi:helix-turn-helix transcriptional regulator [Aristaeella lactis]|uniref:Helix-turn-helix n=1 Tax=Aristaeella lactis TaxID=3046383 RepID=A0AC61PL56_9FIRM|nr:helix-turn-helix transcriptional regulator [Aristaeella lactis]QUA52178.1 helix-turn-helix transcriptional regulator [Aristaeella lactis]SMC58448.1 Helix-turn-helix [Aristaeella lactis]